MFKILNNLRNLQHHTTSKHLGIRYPCDNCVYKGTTKTNLKRHTEKCSKLLRNFQERSEEQTLKNSPSTNVTEPDLVSREPEQEALDQNNFVNLEERHKAENDEHGLQCNQCLIYFSNLSDMQQHTILANLKISHLCDNCEYKVTTKSDLERHIQKVHAQF